MNYNKLPLVIRDIIFKKFVSILDIYEYFDELLKLRKVNKEFKYLVDRELKNFFTLRKISPYGELSSKTDSKSIFLRDIIVRNLSEDLYKVTEIEKDSNGRLLCGICDKILHSECYMSQKSDRLDYYGYSFYDYMIFELICWNCYQSVYPSLANNHIKYEDNLNICQKVNDFYYSLII